MTYRQMLLEAGDRLKEKQIPDASVDAWYLLEYVTGMNRTGFLLHGTREMPEEQCEQYRELVCRRASHVPLQHITGEQEFMGFPFLVNEHVLIPRQDTEVLVEETLQKIRQMGKKCSVLDLCTGSGCIAISIKKLADPVCVTASDLSEEALAVARENGKRLDAAVIWKQGNLFEAFSQEERFDVIVSNPPYINTSVIDTLSEEVRLHEPYMALDGHEDGLYFYREIIQKGKKYINHGGWLLFEIGYDQGEAVKQLMEEQHFHDVQIKKDLAGLDRIVSGRKEFIDV